MIFDNCRPHVSGFATWWEFLQKSENYIANTDVELQEMLDAAQEWAEANGMEFNPDKSKVVVVHKSYVPKARKAKWKCVLCFINPQID